MSRIELDFDAFWAGGCWLKIGKKMAARKFKASVKSEEDWIAIQKAAANYEKHLRENKWKTPQQGSTWFNNWLDWIEFQERVSNKLSPSDPGYYKLMKDSE